MICSYFAVNLNRDHTLQIQELHTLIWLLEGQEPSLTRLKESRKLMDSNKDGTVQLIEWIKYLGFIEGPSGIFEIDLKLIKYFNQVFFILVPNRKYSSS